MTGTMNRTAPRDMGRPSKYSPKLAREILQRLASGEMLMGILRSKGMPGRSSVYRWMKEKPDFRDNYARARGIGAFPGGGRACHPGRQHPGTRPPGQQPRQLSPLAGREDECTLRKQASRRTGRIQRRPGAGIRPKEGNQV